MNYCGFNIELFCSYVCGDHRRPQILAEICRNMGICCGFRAVATREWYREFMLFTPDILGENCEYIDKKKYRVTMIPHHRLACIRECAGFMPWGNSLTPEFPFGTSTMLGFIWRLYLKSSLWIQHGANLYYETFDILLIGYINIIFRNNSYTFPFNSITEGPLLKCLFHTAHNARHSKDVDALKFQLVRHDTFYNGQNQQDSTECLLMLISIIHKGSLPESNSTTCPMGASLFDILFSFVLEKYIVCDLCRLRSPSFESSSVLYISPTDNSSVQNLILQGLQQKLQKSCSRCNKNTWHVDSSYILQPPKYLLVFVNRFRYINNNVTKDRCSIPLDTTVRLGPLKFSLRATIDHHGPSIHSGHYTASINCCKKTFHCNDHTITEFGIIDSKNASTAYVILYELIDTWFLDSNRRVGVWSLPWRWHILSIPLTTGRGTGAETCGLDVFPPDDLCSRPEALCIYIYIIFYMSSVFFGLPIVSCSLMIIV